MKRCMNTCAVVGPFRNYLYANLGHVARAHDSRTRETFLTFLKESGIDKNTNFLFTLADKGYSSKTPTPGHSNSLAAYKTEKIKKLSLEDSLVCRFNAKSWNTWVNAVRREVEIVFGTTYLCFPVFKNSSLDNSDDVIRFSLAALYINNYINCFTRNFEFDAFSNVETIDVTIEDFKNPEKPSADELQCAFGEAYNMFKNISSKQDEKIKYL